jgi:hypothetical protein
MRTLTTGGGPPQIGHSNLVVTGWAVQKVLDRGGGEGRERCELAPNNPRKAKHGWQPRCRTWRQARVPSTSSREDQAPVVAGT